MAQTFRFIRDDNGASFNFLTGDLRLEHGTFTPPTAKTRSRVTTSFRVVNASGATEAQIRTAESTIADQLRQAREYDLSDTAEEATAWYLEWGPAGMDPLRLPIVDGMITFFNQHNMTAMLDENDAKFTIDLTVIAPGEDHGTPVGIIANDVVHATANKLSGTTLTGNTEGRIAALTFVPNFGYVPRSGTKGLHIGIRTHRDNRTENTFQATIAPADWLKPNVANPIFGASLANYSDSFSVAYDVLEGDVAGGTNSNGEWVPACYLTVSRLLARYPTVNSATMTAADYFGRFRLLASIRVTTGYSYAFRLGQTNGSPDSNFYETPENYRLTGPSIAIEGDNKMHLYDMGIFTFPTMSAKEKHNWANDLNANSAISLHVQYLSGTTSTTDTIKVGYCYLMPAERYWYFDERILYAVDNVATQEAYGAAYLHAHNGEQQAAQYYIHYDTQVPDEYAVYGGLPPNVENMTLPTRDCSIVWVADHPTEFTPQTTIRGDFFIKGYNAYNLFKS